ncbi:MAG: glycosyltransferase, partial [Acidimicrobiales bacterium]
MSERRRSVYVAIDTGVDPVAYGEAYRRDEVPDVLPYGLHQLGDHGFDLRFLPPRRTGLLTRVVAEAGRRATLDLNPWSLAEAAASRRAADAVLAWEERVGLPVALARRLGEPPCVTGVIWMTDRHDQVPEPYRRVVRAALARAAGVFVLSSAQVEPLTDQWGVAAEVVHHVPFGIPVEQWASHAGVDQEEALVVAAGNDWDRDHHLLVGAVREVNRKGVGLRLELLTERDIDVEPGLGVRRQAAGLADIRRVYGRASFVTVATRPNLHASGMTVALEAMASGRAVIASATPGMEDYVVDGETGFLVRPGDLHALAERMQLLVGDPD